MQTLFVYLIRFFLFYIISTGVNAETLRIGLFGEHRSLDPIYSVSTAEYYVLNQTMEGLTALGKNGDLVAGSAKSWDVSDDQTRYTFHLRDNLRWSDGTPIVAEDFLRTLTRLHDPNNNDSNKTDYLAVFIKNSRDIFAQKKPISSLGVKVIDDKTLSFTLEQPVAFFPHIVWHPVYAPTPKHVDNDKIGYVVNGAYMPVKYQPKKSLELVKNPYYYNAPNIFYDKLSMTYPTSPDEALHKVLRNKIDVLERLIGEQVREIGNSQLTHVQKVRINRKTTNYISFNTKHPKLDNIKLRRAMSLAINRPAIANELGIDSSVQAYSLAAMSEATGWQVMSSPWAKKSQLERVAMAQTLMRELGYSPFKRLKIEFKVNKSRAVERMAYRIQKNWADIWIDAKVVVQPIKDHYMNLERHEYQVARAGWIADYDDPSTYLYMLDDGHFGQWSNTEYRAIAKQLKTEALQNKQRFDLFRRMEKIIQEEVPVAPVFYTMRYIVLSNRIKYPIKKEVPYIPYQYLTKNDVD